MTTEWRYLLSLTMDGESLSGEEGDALATALRSAENAGEALNALAFEAALHRLHRAKTAARSLRARETLLAKALLREKRRSRRHQATRRSPLARFAAAASFLLAAAAVAVLAFRTQPPSSVPLRPASVVASISQSEDARLAHPDGTLRSAKAGTPLYEGDRISTGLGGSVRFTFPNEPTQIELAGGTALRLLPGAPGRRLRLDVGSLTARVAPQPAGHPLVIVTPQTEATVLGTTLDLTTGPDQTRLAVTEGRVRLERVADRASVLVPAGHYAIADRSTSQPMRAEPIVAVPPSLPPEQPPARRFAVPAGFSAFGGRWEALDGILWADGGEGPKLLGGVPDLSTGECGVDVFFADREPGNAGLIVKVSEAGEGADRFNGYEIALSPAGRHLRLGYHRQNFELIRDVPCEVPVGRWIPLTVTFTGTTLDVSVNGAHVVRFEDKVHPLRTGGIGLRTWLREARFRELWIRPGGERKPLPFLQESP